MHNENDQWTRLPVAVVALAIMWSGSVASAQTGGSRSSAANAGQNDEKDKKQAEAEKKASEKRAKELARQQNKAGQSKIEAPPLPPPVPPGPVVTQLESTAGLAKILTTQLEHRARQHSAVASELDGLSLPPPARPSDLVKPLEALSVGMIRLRDGLDGQAAKLQRALPQASPVQALLAKDEIASLQAAAGRVAGAVVELGSARDKLSAKSRTPTDWEAVKAALRTAATYADQDRSDWASLLMKIGDELRAARDRVVGEVRAHQSAETAAPTYSPPGSEWFWGTWIRRPGQDGPHRMELKQKEYVWLLQVNGRPCEVKISDRDADHTGATVVKGQWSGGRIEARLRPLSDSEMFLELLSESHPDCIAYAATRYERERPATAPAQPGTAGSPCAGFLGHWKSHDQRWIFEFKPSYGDRLTLIHSASSGGSSKEYDVRCQSPHRVIVDGLGFNDGYSRVLELMSGEQAITVVPRPFGSTDRLLR